MLAQVCPQSIDDISSAPLIFQETVSDMWNTNHHLFMLRIALDHTFMRWRDAKKNADSAKAAGNSFISVEEKNIVVELEEYFFCLYCARLDEYKEILKARYQSFYKEPLDEMNMADIEKAVLDVERDSRNKGASAFSPVVLPQKRACTNNSKLTHRNSKRAKWATREVITISSDSEEEQEYKKRAGISKTSSTAETIDLLESDEENDFVAPIASADTAAAASATNVRDSDNMHELANMMGTNFEEQVAAARLYSLF